MDSQKEAAKHRKRAQRTLDRMLDVLKPFLPKPPASEPEPPEEWHIVDGATKLESTEEHETPV